MNYVGNGVDMPVVSLLTVHCDRWKHQMPRRAGTSFVHCDADTRGYQWLRGQFYYAYLLNHKFKT